MGAISRLLSFVFSGTCYQLHAETNLHFKVAVARD
jgi:hypothetical protein